MTRGRSKAISNEINGRKIAPGEVKKGRLSDLSLIHFCFRYPWHSADITSPGVASPKSDETKKVAV